MVRKIEGPRIQSQPAAGAATPPPAPTAASSATGDAFEKAAVGSLAAHLGSGQSTSSLARTSPSLLGPFRGALAVTPLDRDAARGIAAANVARMADIARSIGGSLRDLMGGEAIDLLDRFGLGAGQGPGRIGRTPPPAEGGLGLEPAGGALLPEGLPRRHDGPFDAVLRAPDPRQAMGNAAARGGSAPTATPVPGQTTEIYSGRAFGIETLMTDGTRVTTQTEVLDGGGLRTSLRTESVAGDVKTTTVVATADGRIATITESDPRSGEARAHAEGDADLIAEERARREQQDSTAETQDPDSAGGNPWGYSNPLTGQSWGPKPFSPTQVNPGRGESVDPGSGPRLAIDPDDLASQPLAHETRGTASPKLTSPDAGVGPGGRPDPPGTPGEEP